MNLLAIETYHPRTNFAYFGADIAQILPAFHVATRTMAIASAFLMADPSHLNDTPSRHQPVWTLGQRSSCLAALSCPLFLVASSDFKSCRRNTPTDAEKVDPMRKRTKRYYFLERWCEVRPEIL
jgi:hypothetical protein